MRRFHAAMPSAISRTLSSLKDAQPFDDGFGMGGGDAGRVGVAGGGVAVSAAAVVGVVVGVSAGVSATGGTVAVGAGVGVSVGRGEAVGVGVGVQGWKMSKEQAGGPDPGTVACRAGQAARRGPAPVAIHDDPDVNTRVGR